MNKSPEVTDWLAKYDNPQKQLVSAVRDVILACDPRVTECIKWQAPTFVYMGNIASFFPEGQETCIADVPQGRDDPRRLARA